MPLGPVASWPREDKVLETLSRSKSHLGPAVGKQIDALMTPENLALMVATLVIWAASHFVGVGEVVDVLLLLVGAAMLGPSIVDVVKNLMEFGKCIEARSEADLDRAAKAFADAFVQGGLTVVMAILLRKGAKSAQARVPNAGPTTSWLEVAKPRGKIGLPNVGADPSGKAIWSKVAETGDASLPAGEGSTTMFGEIVYSVQGSITEQQLVLLHERLHAALTPKFVLFRQLRAQLKWAGYSKSVFLQAIEESLAETYAQLRVNGFKGILRGIWFPIGNKYVSVSQLATEGLAIGTIFLGAQQFFVSIIGGPDTWPPEDLPPEDAGKAPAEDDTITVTGGRKVICAPGSSLSSIAGKELGDQKLWPLLWDLNRERIGDNPNRIKAGLELLVLPLSAYTPQELADARKRAPTWKNYPM